MDGLGPAAGMRLGKDGNYYGSTAAGGTHYSCVQGCGTLFKIDPSGSITTLHDFNGTDGTDAAHSLIQASDGNFYGTTNAGGVGTVECPVGCGTVFKMTPSGKLTTFYSFCQETNCDDGAGPDAPLIQARDGDFYGTTSSGGVNCLPGPGKGCGVIYKITTYGTLTTLYAFCSLPNCADGDDPFGGLIQASDGNFYGMTSNLGAKGCGTIYRFAPDGTFATLYSFGSQPNSADGCDANGELIQASDGNLYGTASLGGAGYGTIFKITLDGQFTVLHTFANTDGALPLGPLLQASNGVLYGTTIFGGHLQCNSGVGCGTVFSLTIGSDR